MTCLASLIRFVASSALLCLALATHVGRAADRAAQEVELRSPDGRVAVFVHAQAPLTYRVAVDGVTIVADSKLGLRLRDGTIGSRATVERTENDAVDSTWTNPFGKRRTVRNHYRELRLALREADYDLPYRVIFRAYDDGVAFRYDLGAPDARREAIVEEELTEFTFATDNHSYAGDHLRAPAEEYDVRGGFAGSQEWEFVRQRLSDLPQDTVTGLPLLTRTPAAWVALAEADLLDWSGLWLARAPLTPNTTAVTLRARLAPRLDGNGLVKVTLPHATPWRVLLIGRQPGDLIESDLVLNLSTPSQLADTAWIKPGLMAWDTWWSDTGKMTTDALKTFVQFAADMGWPYQLVDWGWYKRGEGSDITKVEPDVDLPELRRFAAERGVRLWLWLHWSDVDRNDYEKAFATYEQWGIAGVKIDFMDRDDQEMVNWYEKITRAAAKHHLMVNFHGAYKPTGLNRTWPNQITREGVLGNEYNKWSTRVTAAHRVTLPFTRFLVGPGDYTPGGFLNRSASAFKAHVSPPQVQGTRASELALFVVYDSPIACVCDHPQNLAGKPGVEFLKIVPTVWDDTRVISSAVAEHVIVARRAGSKWYLGALNNGVGRLRTIPLSFLGQGRWKMRWWHDARDSGDQAEHLDVEEREIRSTESLDLRMAGGGGAVAVFEPLP